ncbi:hypothetical protein SRHO_G00031240 [Serrasalmus rhombeus]
MRELLVQLFRPHVLCAHLLRGKLEQSQRRVPRPACVVGLGTPWHLLAPPGTSGNRSEDTMRKEKDSRKIMRIFRMDKLCRKKAGEGHVRGNEAGEGHVRGNEAGEGHVRGNEAGEGHVRGNEAGEGHVRGNEAGEGHVRGNEAGEGHVRGNEAGEGHVRGNEAGEGHVRGNEAGEGHVRGNEAGEGHMGKELWTSSLERYISFGKQRTITGDGFPPSEPDVAPEATLRHTPQAS